MVNLSKSEFVPVGEVEDAESFGWSVMLQGGEFPYGLIGNAFSFFG